MRSPKPRSFKTALQSGLRSLPHSLCFSPFFLDGEEVCHLQVDKVALSSLKVPDFFFFGSTLKEPIKV